VHGLQTVQAAKTAAANRLEAELAHQEACLKAANAKVQRLEEAAEAANSELAAARAAASEAAARHAVVVGELAAAHLQVCSWAFGICLTGLTAVP